MDRVFQELAGLLRGISRGSPSSPASPQTNPSFLIFLLRYTFYFKSFLISKIAARCRGTTIFARLIMALMMKNSKLGGNFLFVKFW